MSYMYPIFLFTERPSPPLNLTHSEQTKDSCLLTWETPLKNGGTPITGYIVERCEEGTDKWLRCNARLCPDLLYRVSVLAFQSLPKTNLKYMIINLSIFKLRKQHLWNSPC